MEIFSIEGWYVLLRWFHVLAGITWIGVLYYFNFIQTPYFGTDLGGQARSAIVRGLVPNALWWFRWGAMITFLTGWLIVFTKLGHDSVPLGSGYMTLILTGGLMGTLMWANVWFVIWPAQQVVIANAEKVAAGGEADPAAGPRGARAGVASRTNTLFSVPMLFFMVAAANFPSLVSGLAMGSASLTIYWEAEASRPAAQRRRPIRSGRKAGTPCTPSASEAPAPRPSSSINNEGLRRLRKWRWACTR